MPPTYGALADGFTHRGEHTAVASLSPLPTVISSNGPHNLHLRWPHHRTQRPLTTKSSPGILQVKQKHPVRMKRSKTAFQPRNRCPKIRHSHAPSATLWPLNRTPASNPSLAILLCIPSTHTSSFSQGSSARMGACVSAFKNAPETLPAEESVERDVTVTDAPEEAKTETTEEPLVTLSETQAETSAAAPAEASAAAPVAEDIATEVKEEPTTTESGTDAKKDAPVAEVAAVAPKAEEAAAPVTEAVAPKAEVVATEKKADSIAAAAESTEKK